MGKWGKSILYLLLALVLLLPAASWTTGMILRGMVRQELQRMASEGEPGSADDLIPPPVFPLQNAALMYQRALTLTPPPPVPPAGWQNFLRTRGKETARLLRRSRPAFDLLAAGFARPQCRYDLDYRQGYRMKLPDFGKVRCLVWLCGLKAEEEIKQGRIFAAQETLAQGLRFVNTLQPDNSLLTVLVKTACRSSLEPAIQKIIAAKAKPDRNLLSQLRLVNDRGKAEILNAMYGERAFGMIFFEELRNASPKSAAAELQLPENGAAWEWKMPGKPLFYYDQWYFLSYWRKNLDEIKQNRNLSPLRPLPNCCLLSRVLIPNLDRALSKVRETLRRYRGLAGAMNRLETVKKSR